MNTRPVIGVIGSGTSMDTTLLIEDQATKQTYECIPYPTGFVLDVPLNLHPGQGNGMARLARTSHGRRLCPLRPS